MYKNIIFDFGGVVVNFNPRDFLMDHFMNRRAEEETYDIVFGSQEWQDLDRDIITREEANKIMLEKAAHANRVFEVQTCLDEWFTMLETKKTTVQIMRKLKAAGYRLYYLTNIPTDVMDELRQREWFSLFDGGIASCDVHLCKPEPEIFTTLMQTCHLAYHSMQAREELQKQNGREPKLSEIAARVGQSPENVAMALESAVTPTSLYEPVYSDGEDSFALLDQLRDATGEESWISDMMFRDTVRALTPRERRIIALRYLNGKTQTQVAKEIGISQAQVSRLEKAALNHIKEQICAN